MRKVLSMFISCRDREVLSSKGKVLLLQSIGSKSRVKGVCERNSLYLPLSCRLSRDILRTTIFSSYFKFTHCVEPSDFLLLKYRTTNLFVDIKNSNLKRSGYLVAYFMSRIQLQNVPTMFPISLVFYIFI